MTAQELRLKYLDFFEKRKHAIIPSASLIPNETDSSVLFTTAGMHPLVPYLLGEKHPRGERVVNVQKCIRTGDIDDVGDNRHLTFFEMMGNWSFGDYFKKESIEWSFEFLTTKEFGLGLDPERLYVTVFMGEPASENGTDEIPRDEESIAVWKNVFEKNSLSNGVAGEDEVVHSDVRIIPLGKDDNFWIAGQTGPCGGDSEMFYDTRPEEGKIEGKFTDLVDNFRLIEIWNNVFMEFNKTADGKYEKLPKPNVDTGMGVERTLAVINGKENVFETELFSSILKKISELSGIEYNDRQKEFRIIADHIRSAVFMISDGVLPSNTERGYVLRRLIRRAIRHGKSIGINKNFSKEIAKVVVDEYSIFYLELRDKSEIIFDELEKEEEKFRKTLERGLREFEKIISSSEKNITGKQAFDLYQTYGFPLELTRELAKEKEMQIDETDFAKELEQHQNKSRTAAAGAFKGGLQDSGEQTKRLHTATHILLASLRKVLGNHVSQKGSNINPERLRFDFSHTEKMTPEQIAQVEELVNATIEAKFEVKFKEMKLEEAKDWGAMGVFDSKYGEMVKVYYIVNDAGEIVSKELCGGPHVSNTGELGHFKIKKEEASSAGVRRIKGVLE